MSSMSRFWLCVVLKLNSSCCFYYFLSIFIDYFIITLPALLFTVPVSLRETRTAGHCWSHRPTASHSFAHSQCVHEKGQIARITSTLQPSSSSHFLCASRLAFLMSAPVAHFMMRMWDYMGHCSISFDIFIFSLLLHSGLYLCDCSTPPPTVSQFPGSSVEFC